MDRGLRGHSNPEPVCTFSMYHRTAYCPGWATWKKYNVPAVPQYCTGNWLPGCSWLDLPESCQDGEEALWVRTNRVPTPNNPLWTCHPSPVAWECLFTHPNSAENSTRARYEVHPRMVTLLPACTTRASLCTQNLGQRGSLPFSRTARKMGLAHLVIRLLALVATPEEAKRGYLSGPR